MGLSPSPLGSVLSLGSQCEQLRLGESENCLVLDTLEKGDSVGQAGVLVSRWSPLHCLEPCSSASADRVSALSSCHPPLLCPAPVQVRDPVQIGLFLVAPALPLGLGNSLRCLLSGLGVSIECSMERDLVLGPL